MKFRPGERARIVYSNYPSVIGRECVVICSHEHLTERVGQQVYVVEVPGVPNNSGTCRWASFEWALEKLLPPGWEKTTWDQCPWRPKVVEEVLS